MTSKKVLIWRRQLLSVSETFIANQSHNLQSWEPVFACRDFVENSFGVVPEVVAPEGDDSALKDALQNSSLVHAHFAPDAIDISALAVAMHVPLIATFHGYDVSVRHLYWNPVARYRLIQMFGRAEKLVAVSGFVADRLLRLGADPRKVVVHHIGIPIIDDIPVDSEIANGILFVGRLVDKKGCDDLLRAVSCLPSKYRNIVVNIVGDGPLRGRLEKLARKLQVNAKFVGSANPDRVQSLMRSSYLLCAPSRRAANGDAEGLPITILEAAANRLAIVSTTSSGIPEAIEDGVSGILVPERSPVQLSLALERLLDDRVLRSKMVSRARLQVVQNFDIRVQCSKLEAIYDEAAQLTHD